VQPSTCGVLEQGRGVHVAILGLRSSRLRTRICRQRRRSADHCTRRALCNGHGDQAPSRQLDYLAAWPRHNTDELKCRAQGFDHGMLLAWNLELLPPE
jgi:hypothetical protein